MRLLIAVLVAAVACSNPRDVSKELKPGTGFGGIPEVGVKIEELLKRIK